MASKVVYKNPVPSDIEVSQSIVPAPIKEIAGMKENSWEYPSHVYPW